MCKQLLCCFQQPSHQFQVYLFVLITKRVWPTVVHDNWKPHLRRSEGRWRRWQKPTVSSTGLILFVQISYRIKRGIVWSLLDPMNSWTIGQQPKERLSEWSVTVGNLPADRWWMQLRKTSHSVDSVALAHLTNPLLLNLSLSFSWVFFHPPSCYDY